jgi:hypothetical protein
MGAPLSTVSTRQPGSWLGCRLGHRRCRSGRYRRWRRNSTPVRYRRRAGSSGQRPLRCRPACPRCRSRRRLRALRSHSRARWTRRRSRRHRRRPRPGRPRCCSGSRRPLLCRCCCRRRDRSKPLRCRSCPGSSHCLRLHKLRRWAFLPLHRHPRSHCKPLRKPCRSGSRRSHSKVGQCRRRRCRLPSHPCFRYKPYRRPCRCGSRRFHSMVGQRHRRRCRLSSPCCRPCQGRYSSGFRQTRSKAHSENHRPHSSRMRRRRHRQHSRPYRCPRSTDHPGHRRFPHLTRKRRAHRHRPRGPWSKHSQPRYTDCRPRRRQVRSSLHRRKPNRGSRPGQRRRRWWLVRPPRSRQARPRPHGQPERPLVHPLVVHPLANQPPHPEQRFRLLRRWWLCRPCRRLWSAFRPCRRRW